MYGCAKRTMYEIILVHGFPIYPHLYPTFSYKSTFEIILLLILVLIFSEFDFALEPKTALTGDSLCCPNISFIKSSSVKPSCGFNSQPNKFAQ